MFLMETAWAGHSLSNYPKGPWIVLDCPWIAIYYTYLGTVRIILLLSQVHEYLDVFC